MLVTVSVMAAWVGAGVAFGEEPLAQPGVMLREGTWDGGVGSFSVPPLLSRSKPAEWPTDGWTRLTIRADRIDIDPVLLPKQQIPPFLKSITAQLESMQATSVSPQPVVQAPVGDTPNQIYLRVRADSLPKTSVMPYRFRNGTSSLRPKLDYRYELMFAGRPFSFTVQNGLRGKDGAAYGDGAQYTIEYDDNKYEYSLGEFGWDSSITAIADLDGDGKPDFIISVGGNNSGFEAILLSSTARPGKNVPTASLSSTGC
jgi:hypothetical protein